MFKPVLDYSKGNKRPTQVPMFCHRRSFDKDLCNIQKNSIQQIMDGQYFSLINSRSGHCFQLTPMGSEIWKSMRKPSTLKEITQQLSKQQQSLHGELSSDDIYEGVQQLCKELFENGFIEQSK